jgi:hypothetical protein
MTSVMINKRNLWRIVGVLALFGVALFLLFWAPTTGDGPDAGPDLLTPSMENIPDSKQLSIEIEPEEK